jgi:4-hydroxy-2-oxoheptanedioate aldolase
MEQPNQSDPFWPTPSPLQRALREGRDGQLVLWVTLGSTSIVEIAGAAGVDAVILDLEHSPFGLEAIEALTLAGESAGMTVLARPGGGDLRDVTRLLDLGISGIVFPVVQSAAGAAAARASLRYPPVGTRGWGGGHVRRLRWTVSPRLRSREYLEAANENVLSIFLIETPAGAAAIEEILEAGRPDAVIFGWGDYGAAVGFDPAPAREAAAGVFAVCRAHGVGVGLDPAQSLVPDFYRGCFTVAGVDSMLISRALGAHTNELRSGRGVRS